jgi:hypothetical protein
MHMRKLGTAILFIALAAGLSGYWLRMMDAYERDERQTLSVGYGNAYNHGDMPLSA